MLFSNIIKYSDKNTLIPNNSVIVVGLSGGPDSVFLLYFLKHLAALRNLTLIAAHLDHQWRQDSHKDVQLCMQLCKDLDVPFVTKTVSELSMPPIAGTPEQKGRAQRRFFLEQVVQEHNADYIALAHHQQDQQETFLIRLIRGATLSGLASMRPKAGIYIRPLLQTSKADILSYLDENGIAYISDPTNQDEAMLRNRIRSKVIPALIACDNRFEQNFMRTLSSLQETEIFLENLTNALFDQISHEDTGVILVDKEKFFSQDAYMQHRILLALLIKNQVPFVPTQSLLAEIMRFLHNKSVKHAIGDQWIVGKKCGAFFVQKMK